MPCKREDYPPPDKRKTPKISSDFIARRQPVRRSGAVNKFISSQLALVSKDNIDRWINDLTSFHNRHTKSQNIDKVAYWLGNQLKQFGYNDSASYHEYTEDGYQLKNVICHKQGTSSKILLFCAHYDTILMRNFEDIESRAPGADDNASGVSVLLEVSRIISKLDFEYSIRFAFFSGEEQGFWGSKQYAEYIKDKKEDLYAVVNLDMCAETGFLATNNTTNVDIDDGTTGSVSTNNEASQILGQKMEQMAVDYTDTRVEYDPIAYSDYMPFEARGYVCIGAYDGSAIEGKNKHYHSDTDIPSNLNIDFLTSVTKMVLAFALNEARANASP
jgi:Zn-dependent M28 family amino/carboxypeptidase